jgi:amino-acid N-acetyltransferase
MVYSNEYQQIRRVYKKDVRAVLALIRQSVDSEELVKRTRTDILAHLEDYWVLEIDRNLVGCVALHIYSEQSLAELACLYVHKKHEGKGYGRKLMAYAEQLAAEKGIKQVMALSTQTFNFFQQKGGYAESTPDILPPERRKKYDASARNSKVMIKNVSVVAPLEASRV